MPIACEPLFIGARRTTSDEVIDQKIACEIAMPSRAITKTAKFHAMVARTWLSVNSTKSRKSSLLRSSFEVSSINGSERILTAYA